MDVIYKQKYAKYKSKYNKLKADNSKNTYYFHGSNQKLEKLIPMPSKVVDNESVVFATSQLWLALVFIPKHTDADIDLGYYDSHPYIMEQYPDAFSLLKNKKGFIYLLNKNNFKSDDRLGMQQHEFISKKEENIIKVIKIDDVFKALQNTNVNIITFDQKMTSIKSVFK